MIYKIQSDLNMNLQELIEIKEITHCKNFDVSFSGAYEQIYKLTNQYPEVDLKEKKLLNSFDSVFQYIMQIYFNKLTSLEGLDKSFFLYNEDRYFEDCDETMIEDITSRNAKLNELLLQNAKDMSFDSVDKTKNYFLLVEIILKFGKDKLSFNTFSEFHNFLIERAKIGKGRKINKNCSIRFINYFPKSNNKTRGTKVPASELTTFGMENLSNVANFITNSGQMFEKIKDKRDNLFEINILEVLVNIHSNYVFFL